MELSAELEDWLDDLPLSRNYAKNFVRVFSDGVLVAEIIARQYPKLVQLHSYSEQNTLEGKRANWQLLNKKALGKLRCPLSNEQIDILSQWSSSEELSDFLSILKLKLAAYEPIYLAQQASITVKSQEEKDTLRIKKHEARKAAAAAAAVAEESPERARSTSAADEPHSHSNARTTPESPPHTALAAKPGSNNKSSNNLSRRRKLGTSSNDTHTVAPADLPSAESIDQMYLKITDSLEADLAQLTQRLDALEAQSADFDTQVKQQRQKNLDDMRKTEMRVARLQLEQREIEQAGLNGVMVAIDNAFASGFETLNDQAWASLEPDHAIDEYAVQQLAAELDKTESKFEQQLQDDDDAASSSDSDDSFVPPPPPRSLVPPQVPAVEQPADSAQANDTTNVVDQQQSSAAQESQSNRSTQDSEPCSQAVQPTVQWLQLWDDDSEKNYFADTRTGATQWGMPTSGIIKCRDKTSGKEYFVDAATEQSAWNVEELSMRIQQVSRST